MITLKKPSIKLLGKTFNIKQNYQKTVGILLLTYYIVFLYFNYSAISGVFHYLTNLPGWLGLLILMLVTLKVTNNNKRYSIIPIQCHSYMWCMSSVIGIYWVIMKSNWSIAETVFLIFAVIYAYLNKAINVRQKKVVQE